MIFLADHTNLLQSMLQKLIYVCLCCGDLSSVDGESYEGMDTQDSANGKMERYVSSSEPGN